MVKVLDKRLASGADQLRVDCLIVRTKLLGLYEAERLLLGHVVVGRGRHLTAN
jgi:hypothetical protein